MLHGQIRVNCVALGAVHTELINIMSAASLPEGSGPEASEKKLQGMLLLFKSKTLTGTVGQPEDMAEAYLWLMRDRSVTGTCVHSDGGDLLVLLQINSGRRANGMMAEGTRHDRGT